MGLVSSFIGVLSQFTINFSPLLLNWPLEKIFLLSLLFQLTSSENMVEHSAVNILITLL